MRFTEINISKKTLTVEAILKKRKSILWIGALSFEERCFASLLELQRLNIEFDEAILLNYTTNVYPQNEEKLKRKINNEVISTITDKIFRLKIKKEDIGVYSFMGLQSFIEKIFERKKNDIVIVDITCMSKLHTLALAEAISKFDNQNFIVAYTTPENYGNLDSLRKESGWKDIIIAPFEDTGLLFNETHSRGLIIPGHEADRLIVALSEIEPTGGLILISETPKRPDLRIVNERNNKKIFRQLTSMRSSNWDKKIVNLDDLPKLTEYVLKEIEDAKQNTAPLILFPYGPKSIIFLVALQMCNQYPDASWFVYPIPSGYNVSYSEGIENTYWLSYEFENVNQLSLF